MPDWTVSTTDREPHPAHQLATATYPPMTRPSRHHRTFLLNGSCQARLAACAHAALQIGHRVVLLPASPAPAALPGGTLVQIEAQTVHACATPGTDVRDGWDLALFTSGSTTGTPHGYGFSTTQLNTVTAWYQSIYHASGDSIILTALPAAYNFTFIAGVLLAARLGARLHLSRSPHDVFHDATQLARTADRLIILANPVVLDQASVSEPPPANITIDSGGAPLSTSAISTYRDHGIDLREGYGLTETASLTHFDTQASTASLGTVGVAMPGIQTTITTSTDKPIINLTGAVTGAPLDLSTSLPGRRLHTTDLGSLDDHGRLRVLGRADDQQIGGLWPRDTLDALGPVLGRRCALVRHPTPGQATVRLLSPVNAAAETSLRAGAAAALGLRPQAITVTHHGATPLLHSVKLTRSTRRPNNLDPT